jgi:hypothetical protein
LLWRQSNQTWSISRGELDSELDSAQSKSNALLYPFRTLSFLLYIIVDGQQTVLTSILYC